MSERYSCDKLRLTLYKYFMDCFIGSYRMTVLIVLSLNGGKTVSFPDMGKFM